MKVQVWYNTSLLDYVKEADHELPPMRGMLELGTRGKSLEGHDYCLAWEGSLGPELADNLHEMAEKIWRTFNVVNGNELPTVLGIRSMSVGDVVRLGTDEFNYALVARSAGFELTGEWPEVDIP